MRRIICGSTDISGYPAINSLRLRRFTEWPARALTRSRRWGRLQSAELEARFRQRMSSSSPSASAPVCATGQGAFAPTQWSLVREAAGTGGAALESLCRAYWPPVYAFIRREGHAAHDAEDLTQEFFHRLLTAESFADATPLKGRFRLFYWCGPLFRCGPLFPWRACLRVWGSSDQAPLRCSRIQDGFRRQSTMARTFTVPSSTV